MQFPLIEGKTRFTKLEMIAVAGRCGFSTNEAQFEHWVDYGFIGKSEKKGRGQGYWSLPQMHLFLRLLEVNQQQGVHRTDLCIIPISGWLYLGDETDIKIEQVERVMRTWQASHPSAKIIREVARETVKHIASERPAEKRKLTHDLVYFAKNLKYPEPEAEDGEAPDDFLYHLNMVIDPRGEGRHNGPEGAELTAKVLLQNFEATRIAMSALLEKKSLPKRYWTSARNLVLYERAQYQQKQPQFAREVAGNPSAELYYQQVADDLVTSACRDLRQVLGYIIANPALCDEWEHRTVKSQMVISPLLLLDGTNYRYLQIQW
jgi:hypothetical protein